MTPRDILVNPFSRWFDLERTLEPLSREDQDAVRDAVVEAYETGHPVPVFLNSTNQRKAA